MTTNRQWLLSARPDGMIGPQNFTYAETNMPEIGDGDVLVVDKGRQVGGRLSTVTLGGTGVWDKGAPFFTVRSDEFKRETEAWPKRVWCNGFVGHPDGHPGGRL